ncbi:GA28568, related [Nocardioides sp. PD653]|nr:GA28568, related [Nocardioides sp. PD653-B2]GAW53294.1 GA28568, related [Nocardioides sp. PD653]
MRKRYSNGQLKKSPALLGDNAPSTSTPSTGVETRAAGDSCPTLMHLTLEGPADTPTAPSRSVG